MEYSHEHQVHGRLALVEQGGRSAVAVVDGVEVLAEGAVVHELLHGLRGLEDGRVAPGRAVAVLDLAEDVGSADPVEQVLHPHQLGPLVGAAEGERRDALALKGLDGLLEVLPGLGDLDLVLGEEGLVVEEHHGLHAAHRDAVDLPVEAAGGDDRRQEAVLQRRVVLEGRGQVDQLVRVDVRLDGAAAPS